MQPHKAREIKQALQTKGFQEHGKRDHNFYFFYYNGRKSNIYTKISLNATDVGKGLCSAMAKQVKLTSPQFEQFIECSLTAEHYVDILRSANFVSE